MSKPDSLLTACKAVADLAGIPWSKAQAIYRALQKTGPDDGWLPTSRGRAVWVANRNLVSRFLIVLATTAHPDDAHDNALRFAGYTENGIGAVPTGPGHRDLPVVLEQAVAHLLWSDLDHPTVTFHLEGGNSRVEIVSANGQVRTFKNSTRDWLPSEYRFVEPERRGLIHHAVTIDPDFFATLPDLVHLGSSGPPTRAAEDGEESDVTHTPDRPS